MSALSKTVQKQVDAANRVADKYYKSLAEGQAPTPPVDGQPVPPADGTADVRVKPNEPVTPDPIPPPPGGEAPPAASVAKLPVEEWEQKYRVLQGKYNAEVPRLQKQGSDQAEAIRRLQEQLTATQTLLASLGDRQAAAAPAGAQPRTPAVASLIKDEEIKEFGADLIDVQRRVAREEIASAVEAEVARRLQPVTQQVTQVAQAATQTAKRVSQQDEQTLLEYMTKECPTWPTLNKDQNFVAWLDQTDPFSGMVRGEMLAQAYKSHDGPRVVTFFNGYLKEHAAVTPTPTPAPAAGTPNKAAPAPQRTLEQLVTPGTPKTGAAGTQDGSGKRVWTGAEIGKFYADKAAGRYNSTTGKAKAEAMEADIFAAQAEGRVR